MDNILHFDEHIKIFNSLKKDCSNLDAFQKLVLETITSGGCIFIAGNGGSAADSQHFAAEIVGRFKKERRPLSAVALTTDTSIITAIANDYSFEDIFKRQIEGLATQKDLFIPISTSGNSKNLIKAIEFCNSNGIRIASLTGSGGVIRDLSSVNISVPSDNTARIQEAHIFLIHLICSFIDEQF